MIPKRDTFEAEENKAEARNTNKIIKPESKSRDFGTLILPSVKRAAIQKTIETTRPITKSKPLEVSTGIWVKGKKKTGNNTITTKSDQKEILSKIFDNILFNKLLLKTLMKAQRLYWYLYHTIN